MSKLIMVGEEKLTKKQYKSRVTFLLSESLDNGLVQHLGTLESLYDVVNGDKLYTVECLIGDFIYYLNRKENILKK